MDPNNQAPAPKLSAEELKNLLLNMSAEERSEILDILHDTHEVEEEKK